MCNIGLTAIGNTTLCFRLYSYELGNILVWNWSVHFSQWTLIYCMSSFSIERNYVWGTFLPQWHICVITFALCFSGCQSLKSDTEQHKKSRADTRTHCTWLERVNNSRGSLANTASLYFSNQVRMLLYWTTYSLKQPGQCHTHKPIHQDILYSWNIICTYCYETITKWPHDPTKKHCQSGEFVSSSFMYWGCKTSSSLWDPWDWWFIIFVWANGVNGEYLFIQLWMCTLTLSTKLQQNPSPVLKDGWTHYLAMQTLAMLILNSTVPPGKWLLTIQFHKCRIVRRNEGPNFSSAFPIIGQTRNPQIIQAAPSIVLLISYISTFLNKLKSMNQTLTPGCCLCLSSPFNMMSAM